MIRKCVVSSLIISTAFHAILMITLTICVANDSIVKNNEGNSGGAAEFFVTDSLSSEQRAKRRRITSQPPAVDYYLPHFSIVYVSLGVTNAVDCSQFASSFAADATQLGTDDETPNGYGEDDYAQLHEECEMKVRKNALLGETVQKGTSRGNDRQPPRVRSAHDMKRLSSPRFVIHLPKRSALVNRLLPWIDRWARRERKEEDRNNFAAEEDGNRGRRQSGHVRDPKRGKRQRKSSLLRTSVDDVVVVGAGISGIAANKVVTSTATTANRRYSSSFSLTHTPSLDGGSDHDELSPHKEWAASLSTMTKTFAEDGGGANFRTQSNRGEFSTASVIPLYFFQPSLSHAMVRANFDSNPCWDRRRGALTSQQIDDVEDDGDGGCNRSLSSSSPPLREMMKPMPFVPSFSIWKQNMFGMFLNSRRTLTMTRNSLSRAAPRGLGAVGSEGVDASASVSVDLVEDAFVAMNLFPSEDAVGKYFRRRSCQRLRDMSDDPRNQSHHRLTAAAGALADIASSVSLWVASLVMNAYASSLPRIVDMLVRIFYPNLPLMVKEAQSWAGSLGSERADERLPLVFFASTPTNPRVDSNTEGDAGFFGYNVRVLEGRDRIGGRIHTIQTVQNGKEFISQETGLDSYQTADLGATFIHFRQYFSKRREGGGATEKEVLIAESNPLLSIAKADEATKTVEKGNIADVRIDLTPVNYSKCRYVGSNGSVIPTAISHDPLLIDLFVGTAYEEVYLGYGELLKEALQRPLLLTRFDRTPSGSDASEQQQYDSAINNNTELDPSLVAALEGAVEDVWLDLCKTHHGSFSANDSDCMEKEFLASPTQKQQLSLYFYQHLVQDLQATAENVSSLLYDGDAAMGPLQDKDVVPRGGMLRVFKKLLSLDARNSLQNGDDQQKKANNKDSEPSTLGVADNIHLNTAVSEVRYSCDHCAIATESFAAFSEFIVRAFTACSVGVLSQMARDAWEVTFETVQDIITVIGITDRQDRTSDDDDEDAFNTMSEQSAAGSVSRLFAALFTAMDAQKNGSNPLRSREAPNVAIANGSQVVVPAVSSLLLIADRFVMVLYESLSLLHDLIEMRIEHNNEEGRAMEKDSSFFVNPLNTFRQSTLAIELFCAAKLLWLIDSVVDTAAFLQARLDGKLAWVDSSAPSVLRTFDDEVSEVSEESDRLPAGVIELFSSSSRSMQTAESHHSLFRARRVIMTLPIGVLQQSLKHHHRERNARGRTDNSGDDDADKDAFATKDLVRFAPPLPKDFTEVITSQLGVSNTVKVLLCFEGRNDHSNDSLKEWFNDRFNTTNSLMDAYSTVPSFFLHAEEEDAGEEKMGKSAANAPSPTPFEGFDFGIPNGPQDPTLLFQGTRGHLEVINLKAIGHSDGCFVVGIDGPLAEAVTRELKKEEESSNNDTDDDGAQSSHRAPLFLTDYILHRLQKVSWAGTSSSLMPSQLPPLDPSRCFVSRWDRPFSRGGYAHRRPIDNEDLLHDFGLLADLTESPISLATAINSTHNQQTIIQRLRTRIKNSPLFQQQPVDAKVAFTGEHTSWSSYGNMQGAYESGVCAARDAIESLIAEDVGFACLSFTSLLFANFIVVVSLVTVIVFTSVVLRSAMRAIL